MTGTAPRGSASLFDDLMTQRHATAQKPFTVATHYASGMQGVAEVWAFGHMRRPFGVSLKECSERCIQAMATVSCRHQVPIFIDTGAYS